MVELVPNRTRCTVLSVGYNLDLAILGGATPMAAAGSFDPDHDAVMRIGGEAPGGGPTLSVGIKCQVRIRHPATSDRQFCSRAKKPARAPNGAEGYDRFGKPFQDAGRKTTPPKAA